MRNGGDEKIHSIRELLNTHGIKLLKSMGQNFLVDANIPAKIVNMSGFNKSNGVLEIGPGLGALTTELSKAVKKVVSVELDKRLVPILSGIFQAQDNVEIIQGDILKLDIKQIAKEKMNGLECHVCANLPYNITTPAITTFIESGVFKSIVVMVQKEVAQRICAKPGSPEYGAFSVYINYHSSPEILFNVAPECFIPRPKVTSSVVKMEVRKKRLLDEEKEKTFFRVVRAAFGQRRKTLVNALFAVFEKTHSKTDISGIVVKCGFDPRVRGEVLSIEDYILLLTICKYLLTNHIKYSKLPIVVEQIKTVATKTKGMFVLMALISEIKCARCDRKYSGVRSRCPYCGERRTGYGKKTEGSDRDNIKMLVSIMIIAVFAIGSGYLFFTADASPGNSNVPDPSEIGSPEEGVVSEDGLIHRPTATPTDTPEPTPTPLPVVTSATIRYGTSPRETEFTVKVGETVEINVVWRPDGVTDPVVRWTSSDEEKFQVVPTQLDQVKVNVTGIGVGTGTLTVYVDDVERSCLVHVVRP